METQQVKRFCQYCGTQLEENANFCGKCGKSTNSAQGAQGAYGGVSQRTVYQRTNFVMETLRNFGSINSTLRILSIASAIILGLLQIFGMGYSVSSWGENYKISAIKFFYELIGNSSQIAGTSESKGPVLWVIGICLAFFLCYAVLIIVYVTLFKYIISDYHIETIVDVDKGMSLCGMVLFGMAIAFGMLIRSKMGDYADMFTINIMCYIGFIYSLLLQVVSRLVIKSQLERE